ncbi:MAG: RNA 2',3'-cyclic phosphodiesterase [Pseudomonadota bacterium]
MMAARLFIALWPEDGVRDALAAWRDGWQWPRHATPVRTARLHVTLHFLGDVAAERLPDLGPALACQFEPFTLSFGHNQLWPHGIAVLEPHSTPAALTTLHAALALRLQQLGVPTDSRPYRPHATLARRAAGATSPQCGPAIDWRVERYALMQSVTGHGGGYATLRSYGASGDIL